MKKNEKGYEKALLQIQKGVEKKVESMSEKQVDENGYNQISCPKCNSELEFSRQIAYPNGEVYFEFDCCECDFYGRIRKGNLYTEKL